MADDSDRRSSHAMRVADDALALEEACDMLPPYAEYAETHSGKTLKGCPRVCDALPAARGQVMAAFDWYREPAAPTGHRDGDLVIDADGWPVTDPRCLDPDAYPPYGNTGNN